MLSRLRLRHFRNYSSLDMDFNAGLNLITGLNGQGKTNILEAVQYLSILRSFRTRKTNDLRQWGSSFFFVEGSLATRADETGPWKISISYAEGRRLRVDGQVVNKAADFIGRVRCIACVPEDIMIVKGGPAERRRFIDMLLCQYSRQYLGDLVNYKMALKSRNRMLKEPAKYDSHAFAAYDNLLVRYGASVICARQKFIFLFADLLAAEGTELFGGKSEVLLQY
ncbi:MAG: DNA replication and repair protein RecF, partial [Lentisphaeria bacterium]